VTVLVSALLLGIVPPVRGQDVTPGGFRGGISAGNAFFLSDVDLNLDQIAPSLQGYREHSGFDGSPTVGLDIGYGLGSRLELHAFGRLVPTTFRIQVDNLSVNLDETLYWLGAEGLLFLGPPGGADPFIVAGGGISAEDRLSGGDNYLDPLFEGGGGVRFPLSDRLDLRVTARDYVIPFNRYEDPALGIETSWQHVLGLTIGTTYGL